MLGVDHGPGNFDAYGARPTEAGERWGLRGWWLARWSADPATVSTVLVLDEQGLAAAWQKSYGGRPALARHLKDGTRLRLSRTYRARFIAAV